MARKRYTYWEYGEEHEFVADDVGDEVRDRRGRVIGRRGYTQFNSGKPTPVTHHEDGSSTVHCGGPCGDLYVDKFGNT